MRGLHRSFPMFLVACLAFCFIAEDAAASRQSFTVSPGIYKSINKIHKMMGEERFDEALALTERTLGKRRINDHERSLLLQTKGYIFTGKEQFPKASEAFEACLKVGALPDATLRDTEYNLAQLYMVLEKYPRVISLLEKWRKLVEVVSGDAWMMLAELMRRIKISRPQWLTVRMLSKFRRIPRSVGWALCFLCTSSLEKSGTLLQRSSAW